MRSKNVAIAGWVGIVGGLAGCASPEPGLERAAISNPDGVDVGSEEQLPAVGMLHVPLFDRESFCSGVLVTPQHFLTAYHCFDGESQPVDGTGLIAAGVQVTFGGDQPTRPPFGEVHRVRRCALHPAGRGAPADGPALLCNERGLRPDGTRSRPRSQRRSGSTTSRSSRSIARFRSHGRTGRSSARTHTSSAHQAQPMVGWERWCARWGRRVRRDRRDGRAKRDRDEALDRSSDRVGGAPSARGRPRLPAARMGRTGFPAGRLGDVRMYGFVLRVSARLSWFTSGRLGWSHPRPSAGRRAVGRARRWDRPLQQSLRQRGLSAKLRLHPSGDRSGR